MEGINDVWNKSINKSITSGWLNRMLLVKGVNSAHYEIIHN